MKLNFKKVNINDLLLFFRNVEGIFSKHCKNICVLYSNSESAEIYILKGIEKTEGNETQYLAFYSNKFEYPQKNIYFLFTEEGSIYLEFEKTWQSSKKFTTKGFVGVFEATQKFQEFEMQCLVSSSEKFKKLEESVKKLKLGHENMFLMNQIQRLWTALTNRL